MSVPPYAFIHVSRPGQQSMPCERCSQIITYLSSNALFGIILGKRVLCQSCWAADILDWRIGEAITAHRFVDEVNKRGGFILTRIED